MKLKIALVVIAFSGLVLSSCTKDKATPSSNNPNNDPNGNTTIDGTYRINKAKQVRTGDTLSANAEMFLYISGGIMTTLETRDGKFWEGRRTETPGSEFCKKVGNELFLGYFDESDTTYYFVVDANVPTKESLVTFIPEPSIDIAGSKGSMGVILSNLLTRDGKILFKGNSPTMGDVLYSADPISKIIVDSLQVDAVSSAFTFADDYYWFGVNNSVRAVDPITGESLLDSDPMGTRPIESITTSGANLLVANSYSDYNGFYDKGKSEIYTVSIADGNAQKLLDLDIYLKSIYYYNGKLYILTDQSLYKCSLEPFTVEKAYQLEPGSTLMMTGITFVGNDPWVYFPYQNKPTIGKLNLN